MKTVYGKIRQPLQRIPPEGIDYWPVNRIVFITPNVRNPVIQQLQNRPQ